MNVGNGEVAPGGGAITVTLAVGCENISHDPNGRVTLHELTEQLASAAFPATTQRLYAVFGFVRDQPGLLIANRIEVVSASGTLIGMVEFPDVVFRADQPSQRVLGSLAGISWPEPGDYSVRFVSRGNVVAAFPMRILKILTAEQAEAAQAVAAPP
jgi:hypothetical protein